MAIFNSYVKLPEGMSKNVEYGSWRYTETPLKNMISSVGMVKFPTEWKAKIMCQNTNQVENPLVNAYTHSYRKSPCLNSENQQLAMFNSKLLTLPEGMFLGLLTF